MKRYWIAATGILLLSAPILFLRARAEVSDRSVEIILDEKAFEKLRLSAGLAPNLFWSAFRAAGATTLGMSEITYQGLRERFSSPEGSFRPPEHLRERLSQAPRRILGSQAGQVPEDLGMGFDTVDLWRALKEGYLLCLRPQSHPGLTQFDLSFVFDGIPWGRASSILFLEERVLGHAPSGRLVDIAGFLRGMPVWLGVVEFFPQRGLRELTLSFSRGAVRVFSVTASEESPPILLSKILRAVQERHVRGIYLHPLPGVGSHTLSRNLRWVEEIGKGLRSRGFTLGRASAISSPRSPLPLFVHQIFAWLLAVAAPLAAFFFILNAMHKRYGVFLLYLAASGLTLAGSLGVAALLSRWEFMSAVEGFRAVKPALLLPPLFALLWISRSRLPDILRSPLQVWQFLAALLVLAAAVLLTVRSGNLSASLTLPGEEFFRETLERLLGIRPRSKEFLFGHPLLWLGIFLMKQDRDWGKWLLALGLVGQASIVNTFCHAHAPLFVSLQRVLWGLVLGALIGVALERIGVRCSVFGKTLRKPLTANR